MYSIPCWLALDVPADSTTETSTVEVDDPPTGRGIPNDMVEVFEELVLEDVELLDAVFEVLGVSKPKSTGGKRSASADLGMLEMSFAGKTGGGGGSSPGGNSGSAPNKNPAPKVRNQTKLLNGKKRLSHHLIYCLNTKSYHCLEV